MKKYKYSVFLALILLMATCLRFVNLSTNPPALNQDEAVNGYDAFTLGKTLRDHHGNFLPIMFESFGDWVSPVLTYVTVPFVKIFGLSIFTIRSVTALLGIGSIWLFYILLKRLFSNKNLALIGAFLLAISPWHIALSRWAISPSVVSFFVFLFLDIFLWTNDEFKQNKNIWYYVMPGIAAGILTLTYPTQKLFVPLFVFTIGIIYLRKNLKSLFIFWLSFALVVLPTFVLTLINPIYNSRFKAVSIFSSRNVFKNIVIRYVEYFLPNFHFGSGDSDVMHQVPGISSSYGFLMPFFYLGIVICILKIKKKTYQLLLAWLLLFPVAASLTEERNMLLRVVHGLPLVIVFFIFCCSYFKKFISKKLKNILVIVIILLGIFNVSKFARIYFIEYPKLSFKEFQYGIKESFDYLDKNANKFEKVIIDENINQPYIYYLFFSKSDPQKLNYSDPSKNSNKYIFGYIPKLKTVPIKTIYFEDERMFDIYDEGNSVWYVKKVY